MMISGGVEKGVLLLGMRYAVISQNCDGLKTGPVLPFDKILSLDPDVYVEMTQEDARPVDSGSLLDPKLLHDYRVLTTVALNSGASSQNLIMTCWIKSDQNALYVSGSHAVSPSGSKIALMAQSVAKGYSKGAVYVKLILKQPILFINMHLPVKTGVGMFTRKLKNNTMGLKYRHRVLVELLREVAHLVDRRTTVFVGGDLNFRMDADGTDQLTRILATEGLPYGLQETVGNYLTCKFTKPNRPCRTRRAGRPTAAYLANVQKNCGANDRVPSRCDRFLIGSPWSYKIHFQDTEVFLPESDHNGIYTCFDLR
jgi:hypothetical protein